MAGIGLLFGLTTAPTSLFYSLMQSWRLPPKYAYSFLAAMRLIPILLEEFIALRQAHLIRGGNRGSKWNLYNTMKRYAIPLLAGSIRRAQRISVAMEAKGFVSEHKRTYYYIVRYSYMDVIFMCYFVLMIIFSWRYGIHFPYLSITDVLS
ncbi:putative HMP/thiamine permease protein YkoC [compost metagenome]